MLSAAAVDRPNVSLADHYFLLLGALLLGYAVFGKLVAYLGIPPLFIGEIMLFAGALVAVRTGCLPAALVSTTSLLIATAMALVMLRTLPYLSTHGFNALRRRWSSSASPMASRPPSSTPTLRSATPSIAR